MFGGDFGLVFGFWVVIWYFDGFVGCLGGCGFEFDDFGRFSFLRVGFLRFDDFDGLVLVSVLLNWSW